VWYTRVSFRVEPTVPSWTGSGDGTAPGQTATAPGRTLLPAPGEPTVVPPQRRHVLTATALLLFAIAGLVLHKVLGTVFLAITVAYLLVPAQRVLLERDVHEWWAAVAVTTGATRSDARRAPPDFGRDVPADRSARARSRVPH